MLLENKRLYSRITRALLLSVILRNMFAVVAIVTASGCPMQGRLSGKCLTREAEWSLKLQYT